MLKRTQARYMKYNSEYWIIINFFHNCGRYRIKYKQNKYMDFRVSMESCSALANKTNLSAFSVELLKLFLNFL